MIPVLCIYKAGNSVTVEVGRRTFHQGAYSTINRYDTRSQCDARIEVGDSYTPSDKTRSSDPEGHVRLRAKSVEAYMFRWIP